MNIFDSASARRLKFAIGRPVYDNRRLGDQLSWITDNFSECKRYYDALGENMENEWHKECLAFCQCQYDQQVLARENERWEKS